MDNTVVAHEAWVRARKELLAKEKEFTKLRDQLSRQRQALPWERVKEDYLFAGPDGPVKLSGLFGDHSQLIVYHFMLGPGWEAGCPACSFLSDHLEPAVVHLNHRDVSVAVVSRAPLAEIQTYKQRMGWSFPWVSSNENTFNFDYNVSFTEEAIEQGDVHYNYRDQRFPSTEAPGASVFYKDGDGNVYHTYSTFQRGLDMFITAYHYLDIVPKGRDEDALPMSMAWVRRHDEYDR